MKALSIKQPWAGLIVAGIKDIENRSWRTNFRGRVYVHASQRNAPSFDFTLAQSRAMDSIGEDHEFLRSAIIGEVEIVDCVRGHTSIWALDKDDDGKEQWHWVLDNAVQYEHPVLNINGGLSFWQPSALTEIKTQVHPGQNFNVKVGYLFENGYWKKHHDYNVLVECINPGEIVCLQGPNTKLILTEEYLSSGYMKLG